MQSVPIQIDEDGLIVKGEADPIHINKYLGVPDEFIITIEGKYIGILSFRDEVWEMNHPVNLELVESIGEYLMEWYE